MQALTTRRSVIGARLQYFAQPPPSLRTPVPRSCLLFEDKPFLVIHIEIYRGMACSRTEAGLAPLFPTMRCSSLVCESLYDVLVVPIALGKYSSESRYLLQQSAIIDNFNPSRIEIVCARLTPPSLWSDHQIKLSRCSGRSKVPLTVI